MAAVLRRRSKVPGGQNLTQKLKPGTSRWRQWPKPGPSPHWQEAHWQGGPSPGPSTSRRPKAAGPTSELKPGRRDWQQHPRDPGRRDPEAQAPGLTGSEPCRARRSEPRRHAGTRAPHTVSLSEAHCRYCSTMAARPTCTGKDPNSIPHGDAPGPLLVARPTVTHTARLLPLRSLSQQSH